MATFFCDVRHLNHQYDNEQDADNGLQWLFSNNDEEHAIVHEQQNNAIDMSCPGCIRREELGHDDMCLGCKLYASTWFAIWMIVFSVPIFVFLVLLIYV